jgi:NADPH:quinone reductase-like Zn-dependent oxidoreductase
MLSPDFPKTMGGDFSGVVMDTEGETAFTKGDKVYGQSVIMIGGSGSFAEQTVANSNNTARKPETASFETAAAVPLAGASALQAITEHMQLRKGQKVLIHGGAGGVGHFAIQLAKMAGAYVATTVKPENVDFVRGLGADEVIDYTTQDFWKILKDYDAVLDNVGGPTLERSFQVLRPEGILVTMLGVVNQELAEKYQVKVVTQFTRTDTNQLQYLAGLIDRSELTVHVAKVFPMEQIQAAFKYKDTHPRGKVVIKVKK